MCKSAVDCDVLTGLLSHHIPKCRPHSAGGDGPGRLPRGLETLLPNCVTVFQPVGPSREARLSHQAVFPGRSTRESAAGRPTRLWPDVIWWLVCVPRKYQGHWFVSLSPPTQSSSLTSTVADKSTGTNERLQNPHVAFLESDGGGLGTYVFGPRVYFSEGKFPCPRVRRCGTIHPPPVAGVPGVWYRIKGVEGPLPMVSRALGRWGCQPLNGASSASEITKSIDPLRRQVGGRGLRLAEFTPADRALWDPCVFHFGESGCAPSPERSVSNTPSWSLGPWMPSQTVSQS